MTVLLIATAAVGVLFVIWFVLVALFAPGVPYHIKTPIDATSDAFVDLLESACQTTLRAGNRIEILTDAAAFYPAMLQAIRDARESINMECYIFKRGEAAETFTPALVERARAGVPVTIVLDTVGSLGLYFSASRRLKAAGCRVQHYRRPVWHDLARLNNRTHRELLVVDGRVAFVGGAGVADWWLKPLKGKPAWRDMMARIDGPIVPDLQGVFAENWLECRGEILAGEHMYKPRVRAGDTAALVVKSSPSDRATASRILFQALIEGAQRRVRVCTPYFLPDRAFRRALIRAAHRGVEILVIVPGSITDQKWLRLASRRVYGRLLKRGVRIFEFQPGMTHVKSLIVDDLWAVVGSTNIDNRSFEHNDEVNVAARDAMVAARLTQDFEADLQRSREITAEGWRHRAIWEKLVGSVAWILDRQQ